MKAYEIQDSGGIDRLALVDRPSPEPGPGQVAVQIRASSLNYRDLATIKDPVSRKLKLPLVPNSDGAGEVVAIGAGVTRVRVGDRVMGTFFQCWDDGEINADRMASALGGAIDGVLAEQVLLDARGLVHTPDYLSDAEAATLPCAALTAWHALIEKGNLDAGETVLLLGTGGVSLFALQIAVLRGARVIIASSSDDKLERARALGAWQTINYKKTPDWHRQAIDLTEGKGVDHVVEVGGPGTLEKSIEAARVSGHIALIGILTGAGGAVVPTGIMRKSLTVHGIYVGSRAMFEAMTQAFALHEIRPVIDRTFSMAEARDAYRHMEGGRHFGKIVVSVS